MTGMSLPERARRWRGLTSRVLPSWVIAVVLPVRAGLDQAAAAGVGVAVEVGQPASLGDDLADDRGRDDQEPGVVVEPGLVVGQPPGVAEPPPLRIGQQFRRGRLLLDEPPPAGQDGELPRNSSKNTCRERSGCPLGKLIPPFSHGGFQNSTPSVRNASSWSTIPNSRPFDWQFGFSTVRSGLAVNVSNASISAAIGINACGIVRPFKIVENPAGPFFAPPF